MDLKSLTLDRLDIEEVVGALAQGRVLIETYEQAKLPVPEWLTERVEELKKEAASRRRDELSKALKRAKLDRERLATAEEKREKKDAEIKRLEEELAGS